MLRDLGILASRATLGLSLAAHGAQKAFGWFGGPGPQAAAGFMESLGFRPGARYAAASSYTEMTAGLLLTLGLGGPLAPAMLVSVMVVAQTAVHAKNGFFAQKGGIELGTMYVAGALAIAMAGYGRYSLDEALELDLLDDERLAWLALAGATGVGIAMLAQRRQAPPTQAG